MRTKITIHHNLTADYLSKRITPALIRVANRCAEVGIKAAREDYMSKRKTQKLPSLIFNSFTYDTKHKGMNEVHMTIFAGGPAASWAIYVDQGHYLRNGKFWQGYHFMDTGRQAIINEVTPIAKDEFSKIKHTR